MTILELKPTTLAFFIDDTGHERYADKNHPVFGLGGCAVMSSHYDLVIRQPWNRVREICTGSAKGRLHAAKFSPIASTKNVQAVESFFQTCQFFRLAVITSSQTTHAEGLSPLQLVCDVLYSRIRDIAQWTPFEEVAIIFEASERLNRPLQRAFRGEVIGLLETGLGCTLAG
jgi:hypothetical protein